LKLRIRSHNWIASDFLLAFAAIVVGMACTFVALSSTSLSYKLLISIFAFGVALTCLSLRSHTRRLSNHEISVCKETVLVDAEASGEIVFAPLTPMKNPTLGLTAHGRPVLVEDVWHDNLSLVASPSPIGNWRRGIVYPGIVDTEHTLRIVVRNTGYTPAAVRANLSAKKSG
jgi:hypothetical protein